VATLGDKDPDLVTKIQLVDGTIFRKKSPHHGKQKIARVAAALLFGRGQLRSFMYMPWPPSVLIQAIKSKTSHHKVEERGDENISHFFL